MKGKTLPKDWKPSVEEIDYGIELGFSEARVRELAEDMRLWAIGNRNRAVARKANWHTTFLGWMRRERDRVRKWQRPHEKGYAELAEDIRNGFDHEPSNRETDLFGSEFAGPGDHRHH